MKTRDPMTAGGQVLKGTPLARLVDALADDAEHASVLAGDVADVCRLCDASDPVVGALKVAATGYAGQTIAVAADDVRHLVDLLTAADGESDAAAEVPAEVPAGGRSRKSAKKSAATDGSETT